MPQTLSYRVENAQLVTLERQTEFEGQSATITFQRAVIESLPISGDGPTFAMVLPPEALAEFPEGAEIAVAVSVTALPVPAAEPVADPVTPAEGA